MKNQRSKMPLKVLREERNALNVVIAELEKLPMRIIDVAYEHSEIKHRYEVLRVDGDLKKDKKWTQLERIFCKSKCKKCPHGDFIYKYSRLKNGKVRTKFYGEPVFNHDLLERLKKEAEKHPPV